MCRSGSAPLASFYLCHCRASRMRRTACCRVETAAVVALMLFGAVYLVVLRREEVAHRQTKHAQLDATEPGRPRLARVGSSFMSTSPTCHRNESAVNVTDFSSLPAHLQDFLYYRHCRDFPMLMDVPDKCGGASGSGEVFLLLVIKSSPWNYERREVLRKTWAQERLQSGVWVRRVFVTGTTGTKFARRRLQMLLQMEQHEHGDILQWDFSDSFFNLTLKQVLFMKWLDRNCPGAHFLLNGDDDIFANTDNMVEYLQSLQDNGGRRHLFTGHLIQNVGPIRVPASKYYVPVQVQESNSYPSYCGGGGFLMSGYTASVIYRSSKSIDVHPIDDVYMGMCLALAGLKPTSHMGVKTAGLHVPSERLDAYDPCFYRDVLLVHRFLPAQMYVMWHGVHDPGLKCLSP